ncbi:MAG: methyl-accepting chemotaxis protein [Phenylobacterium sp.]|uniref:methyl-accepting chemotaxis protein n=1 Tax=Phenylobacterium sp. TaxID=1871053 RepID=UPI0027171F11|nr:methyl-accepting chemotaxis protein [Phenylobacterium sp.]MDO8901798.1 methyl-accepting chemotaxis protein [Phenylobacterium sp.]
MTISKRIQLILVPPLLALLVAMAALLAQSWNGLQRTGAILDEIAAATAGGRLVHELQAERSLSNLGLTMGTPADKLDDQRTRVDAAAQAYRAAVAHAPPQISAQVLAALESLPSLRAEIDAGGLTTERLLAGYAELIDAELASLEEVAIDAAQEGHTLGATFRAYDAAVIGKELAAEERALTLGSLAAGGLTPDALATLSRLQGGEATAFAFLDHTTEPGVSQAWKAFLASSEHRAVVELRDAIRAGEAPSTAAWNDAAGRRAEALHSLEDALAQQVDAAAQTAAAAHRRTLGLLALILSVTLIGVVALGLRVARAITRPMADLTDSMGRLAEGDTSVAVRHVDRRDELGVMSRALAHFRDILVAKREADAELAQAEARALQDRQAAEARALAEERALVAGSIGAAISRLADGDLTHRLSRDLPEAYLQLATDYNGAMDRVSAIMGAIAELTGTLHGSAEELSRASDALSRRTEQQAASLEESAAALEQTAQSVRKTANGVGHTRDVIAGTTKASQDTSAVVRDAVAAMARIENSAGRISTIIGVIDEIAFQTNLLALNAGVEAARAGDAGRGFAVVASEVRALAQRSADAAKEIKGLIAASSENVNEGVGLVRRTGGAISEITEQVSAIDSLVAEIAGSAEEQAHALALVSQAVSQMDSVTQQNAAMSEESTAASQSVSHEADRLRQMIAHFRISRGGGGLQRAAA